MYFTPFQIVNSIHALRDIHPFYGITFLACKKDGLPVGSTIVFPLDAKTDKFLQTYHHLNPRSSAFFQPFKSSDRSKKWVKSDYSAKGLQAINTQTFAPAFIHESGSRVWGWDSNYIEILSKKLLKKEKIPAFDLAVWLYRNHDWPIDTKKSEVIEKFISDFNLTHKEFEFLFKDNLSNNNINNLVQDSKVDWNDLSSLLPSPPDAEPDGGGTLTYLETRGIGPADIFKIYPAKRLTIITGDNGLGKSFLLETAWLALTGKWADKPIHPRRDSKYSKYNNGEIIFEIEGERSKAQRRTTTYDWKNLSWHSPDKRPTMAGLTIYARVDGSFAIWDPARANSNSKTTVFTKTETWDGLPGQIEGLIRDWVRWQNNPAGGQFNNFKEVLDMLSPSDLGKLTPGTSIRIPDDPREIPTLKHPYGEIPITHESAGVRRVITLAYLLVWSWHEHLIAAELSNTDAQRKMVVLIDEIEAHLHPRWQRTLLPALLRVREVLSPSLDVQYIVATHSPLVMASSEAIFEDQEDKLFHLDMQKSGEIALKEIPFIKYGDVSAWLTSPVFELRHARSSEAEAAIEAAKSLQLAENINKLAVENVNANLIKYLAADDRFWPRWVSFAERFGVIS
ncbi:MAG: ATP-binding protein [Burkholderiales bacterium]|nr:ATP-binding protein [Burkholderiales bacterium]